MTTRTLVSTSWRLAGAVLCTLSVTSCGGEMLRTGRAPMYLVVQQVQASANNSTTFTGFLLSDVRSDDGSAQNDNAQVTLRLEPKNPSAPTSPINAVTLTRYHVEFKRADGRNRPGIDVPWGFDGVLSTTIQPGGTATVGFELVRHAAKREAPLSALVGGGGLRLLDAIAEMTLYGRDQNGNEVQVTATMDVHFADFGG